MDVNKFIEIARTYCEYLVDSKATYSNTAACVSYLNTMNQKVPKTNCARMVVQALQISKVLKTNQSFYGHNDGSIKCKNISLDALKLHFDITHYANGKKRTSDLNLKPGDIVCYYGQHTNLYLGTYQGKKHWLDAGRWTTIPWKTFERSGEISMWVSNVLRPRDNSKALSENPYCTGKVVKAKSIKIRTYAGVKYAPITSYPTIKKGTKVDICDEVKSEKGVTWYFIRYKKKYGFVHSGYIEIV